ncbi:hypothetical protein [Rickettsiella endosymbiont of Aleochara curtula]|uniref:hypothetical protein n=1 Tax=Rickettsiella endosymbiont of Aleochara curtula TaxID=3077936 RepID=UPI00313EB53A
MQTMGSAGLSSEIKLANPLAQRLVSDVAVAAMSSVVRGRFDVENLATQLITDAAAVGMQQRQTKPVSDEYHQSKKASRGEGHITQTTIDQQWDAHLINDAEFTANTPLPSVTFNVNDSYVSQQLGQRVGEEVSHFYHPTPPPPRNPTGFWRGVDDVLEMQEGTRKAADLIFTGHYEVPKNRWQKAGFDIGVPLAIGAQIVMAGERVGVEAVGAIESVYQGGQRVFGSVASNLERWGLFGNKQISTTESSRLLSSIERVPSNVVNKSFITEKALAAGWKQPYPDNVSLRKITTAQEIKLYRVHTDPNRVEGTFLAREKEIAPFLSDPEALRIHLGLREVPVYITEVNVPAGSELYVGRIGPQPSFGLIDKSGFQYQTVEQLPESSFVNTRPILRPSLNLNMSY